MTDIRNIARSSTLLTRTVAAALWMGLAVAACGADLHVDPAGGDDARDGVEHAVQTISRAIQLAQPGDTIHLQPVVYRDWAAFFDKSGEPGRPIVLDGHGATLDGCDPLQPQDWTESEPGLFFNANLMPLTDAIIDRWFFVFDGQLNRMGRCSKGPSLPLKMPADLQPGEWTFIKDEERTQTARAGYILGTFWLKLAPAMALADARVEVPVRMAGVAMRGNSQHLAVRNLTATRPYNDGYNLSDCRDVAFENIRAIDCGDDGISAHGECLYTVDGFTSIGNATGICDTGNSQTSYRGVFIDRCLGFDLFFLDTGRYAVSDAHIRSASAKPLYLLGREAPAASCTVTLNNVWLERVGDAAEVRVSPGCRLQASRSTFSHLDWQATGGEINLEQCVVEGNIPLDPARPPRLHLWPDARWHGDGNRYAWDSIRVGDRAFAANDLAAFREATNSDRGSLWPAENTPPHPGIGVDRQRLPSAETAAEPARK
ncbi:MAG: hypothetical protein AB7O62_21870 [Pirellulales bacterium]